MDEAAFRTCTNHRRRIWRQRRERGISVQSVRGCGWTSVGVFAGLCGDQLLPLYFISGDMDAGQYRDVMSELYWPVLREEFGTRPFRFLQDNCPAHKSRIVRDWVDAQPGLKEAWQYLPPYSPTSIP